MSEPDKKRLRGYIRTAWSAAKKEGDAVHRHPNIIAALVVAAAIDRQTNVLDTAIRVAADAPVTIYDDDDEADAD